MSKGTRQTLLEAAERVLIEEGVHALTVRRVGAVSGLNPALITYHFGSVAALLGELAHANLERLSRDWDCLNEPVPPDEPALETCLDRWLRPLTRRAAFNATGRALVVLDEIAAHGDPELARTVLDAMIAVSGTVQAQLQPLLPHLSAFELRARLRFIAGAALGPPPRTAATRAVQDPIDGIDQLLAFARAALRG